VTHNQPEPGAQLHDGSASVARPAATVILLRGGSEQMEVLLVQRNPQARFVAGAWVFPGGAVDTIDGNGQAGLKAAARRELSEEAGIDLAGTAELVAFARWITPLAIKKRFDTWFYLARAPDGVEPRVDGAEIIDARWLSPSQALKQQADGELFLVFPTIKQLEQLAEFRSVEALLEYATGREVAPVQPRIVGAAETARILLPGDPGYS
jgi:8-oxo-dGTP pyrophosphatase MutT (NUDIX family)